MLKNVLNLNKRSKFFKISIIIGAIGCGIYFKYTSSHIDHPIEQAAESILEAHGVDIDFSEDKKKNT